MSVWHIILGVVIALVGFGLAAACCYVNVDPNKEAEAQLSCDREWSRKNNEKM